MGQVVHDQQGVGADHVGARPGALAGHPQPVARVGAELHQHGPGVLQREHVLGAVLDALVQGQHLVEIGLGGFAQDHGAHAGSPSDAATAAAWRSWQ
ncbi:hypothetical protein D3C87_1886070 [compost metagenome]